MATRKHIKILAGIIGALITIYLVQNRKVTQKSSAKETVLIVGTNAEYPPFSTIENNHIVGLDIDIIKEVAQRLGKTIEIKDMPFDSLIPAIQLGKVHVIAAGMSATPERARTVYFTKPHFSADPLVILTLAHKPEVHSVLELAEKNVVVNEGYRADYYVSAITGPILLRLATPAEALLALRANRAYAFITAQSALQPLLKNIDATKYRLNTIDDEAATDNYALAISKKYPGLYKQIQAVLDEMERDGTRKRLCEKWRLI